MKKVICKKCNKEYNGYQKNRHCIECRKTKINDTFYSFPYQRKIKSGNIGLIHELRVAQDLISKGYEVYFHLSSGVPSDLIASKNSKLYRIEVTTGYTRKIDNKIIIKKEKLNSNRHDVLGVVSTMGVLYIPDILK